jgi:hypothetical protein
MLGITPIPGENRKVNGGIPAHWAINCSLSGKLALILGVDKMNRIVL